jgi:hypothetical protein|tara:strand:+ start:584 stop:910 length:327 start_codon:yes stop_codon:yes gene_type:complete
MFIPKLYVAMISNLRHLITLAGSSCDQYESFPNVKYIREEVKRGSKVVIEKEVLLGFQSEYELYEFIQKLINKGVPFSNYSKDAGSAYNSVSNLINSGKLLGSVKKLE